MMSAQEGEGGGLAIRKPMLIDKAVAYRSLGVVLLVSLRNKNIKKTAHWTWQARIKNWIVSKAIEELRKQKRCIFEVFKNFYLLLILLCMKLTERFGNLLRLFRICCGLFWILEHKYKCVEYTYNAYFLGKYIFIVFSNLYRGCKIIFHIFLLSSFLSTKALKIRLYSSS